MNVLINVFKRFLVNKEKNIALWNEYDVLAVHNSNDKLVFMLLIITKIVFYTTYTYC